MPICIAGMHRSGTSMVAQLLHLCGLYLGDRHEIRGPGRYNAEGYWEHRGFVHLNEQVLASLGTGWDLPFDVAPGWEWLPELQELRTAAAALVGRFRYCEPWGWKDPRNSLTLPFWQSLVPGLRVVVCLRHPAEVAQSLHRRGSSSLRFGYELWLSYHHQILQAIPTDTLVFTHYDAYFHDPGQELRRVADCLGLQVADHIIERSCSSVLGHLRHHKTSAEGLRAPEVPAQVAPLYEMMCEHAGQVCKAALGESQPVAARLPACPEGPDEVASKQASSIHGHALARPRHAGRPGMTLVSVILPSHTSASDLPECITSLTGEVAEVQIPSCAAASSVVPGELPGVRLVHHEPGHSWASVANLAATQASGAYLLFLDPDVTVGTDVLASWVATLEADHHVAAIGAPPREGVDPFLLGSSSPLGVLGPSLYVARQAALYRRDTFRSADGFETEHFADREHVELGWRLWLRGHQCLTAEGAQIVDAGVPGGQDCASVRGSRAKEALVAALVMLESQYLTRVLPSLLAKLLASSPWIVATALEDIFAELPALLARRARVQAARACTDEEVFARVTHPFAPVLGEALHAATCDSSTLDPDHPLQARMAILAWLNAAHLAHEQWLAAELEGLQQQMRDVESSPAGKAASALSGLRTRLLPRGSLQARALWVWRNQGFSTVVRRGADRVRELFRRPGRAGL